MSASDLPPHWFDRADESPDDRFYSLPRLVTHIDDATIDALAAFYGETLAAGSDVLDWMSSWVSHLPDAPDLGRVSGLGMNAQELAANPRLTDWVVHDLNREPVLPFEPASFDVALNAVSIQYLVQPVPVFASVARVLRPGGLSIVAMSHRCFPTKAVRAFHYLDAKGRFDLVTRYHEQAGGFEDVRCIDRSPAGADPLWIVTARRAAEPT